MKTTPTLDRLASTDRTPGSHRTARRRAAWLTVLGLLVVGLIAIGFALSRVDTAEEPATDVPSEEPAAEQPGTGDPPGQAPMIRYHEELRANWDVVGVAAGDVLNVRDVPGVAGTIIAVLAHDAAELESTGRIAYVGGQLWREVIVPGDGAGWVNAAHLTETAPPSTIRYDEELRANWDVVGVAAGDVLNVRDVPGVAGTIIAVLAHDAAELESTGRIAYVGGQLWREVIVPGDGAGWVSARYLGES